MIRFEDLCDDCVLPGERVLSDVEKAYRRGFSQGAAITFYAFSEGVPLGSIERWIARIMTWRRKAQYWRRGQMVKAQLPPLEPRGQGSPC